MATNTQGYQINKNPIAQSFYVDTIAGIFVTKIDLFFATKDPDFPVNLHLRTMTNGLPTFDVIPGSNVVKSGGSVNTSVDATVATTFQFDEPLYLQGQTDYAMVITANSPDYKVYVAEINEFLIGSTEKRIDRQPILGSLFFSQNNATWTPAQAKDLTFKLYQADFGRKSGEIFLTNAVLPQTLLTSDPITVVTGDATATVYQPMHGLQVGEDITIRDAIATGGVNASSINGARTITAVDWTGYQFEMDSTADSDVIGGGSNVLSSKNIPFNVLWPNISQIVPKNTNMTSWIRMTKSKSFAGTETAFVKETEFSTIEINATNFTKIPFMVAHDSSESNELAGLKSLDVSLPMITTDSDVSPMLDLQRASVTLVSHIIDRPDSVASDGFNTHFNFVNETEPNGGSSAAKHIMEPITLDQDAVGLKIILSAYRPPSTDFLVYYRTATGDENIIEKYWTLQPEETNNPTDEISVREYRYTPGGIGGSLPAFTQFQVKIVMRSTNTAKVPLFKDVRVIALSV